MVNLIKLSDRSAFLTMQVTQLLFLQMEKVWRCSMREAAG